MSLLIREGESGWHEPVGHGYDNEAGLQAILVEHPDLVPGVTVGAIACSEFESGVGPADVIILNPEGEITVVECKLRANTEVRRTVVGQILDYASRLWQMDIAQFEQQWMRADGGRSPFERLDDTDGRARAAVASNLRSAKFNLVLAVDELNEDLRRIVEYLNSVTRPTTGIMLVEFRRLHEGTLEILIPRSFGAELVDAKVDASRGKRRWTIPQYRQWCADHDSGTLVTVDALLAALAEQGFEVIGGQAVTPSLNMCVKNDRRGRIWLLNLYTDEARGPLVEVKYNGFGTGHEAAEFARRICAVPGVSITPQVLKECGYQRRPSMPLSEFGPDTIRQLVETVAIARNL